jgi:hypothetical protein
MNSPLENLAQPGGPLAAEAPDAKELAVLLNSGRKRLADARNPVLAIESRFDLAYNASHALCLAALRRAGYRPRHRYIVFHALPHTLGLGAEVWRVLSKGHDVRNLSEYEGELNVTERLVADIVDASEAVSSALARLKALE